MCENRTGFTNPAFSITLSASVTLVNTWIQSGFTIGDATIGASPNTRAPLTCASVWLSLLSQTLIIMLLSDICFTGVKVNVVFMSYAANSLCIATSVTNPLGSWTWTPSCLSMLIQVSAFPVVVSFPLKFMKSIACCHVNEPLVMDCLIVIDTGLSSGNTCCGTGLLNFEISNTCPLILSPSLNVCNKTPPRDGRDSDGELLPLGIWKFIGTTGGSGIANV